MVWVGGMAFFIFVVVPVMRNPQLEASRGGVIRGMGFRFRTIGWIALGSLVITGIINLGFRGYHVVDLISGRIFQTSFGHILSFKLIGVALILLVSLAHDYWIGPIASRWSRESPGAPKAVRARRFAVLLGRFNFILALIVVAFAVLLIRVG